MSSTSSNWRSYVSAQRLTPSLVRVSCAVIRMRSPSFRTPPSRIVSTRSFSPIDRASALLPLNAKDECRLMMRSPGTFDKLLNEFLGDAVSEIFHVSAGTQIGERQHRDAGRQRCGRGIGGTGGCRRWPESESNQQPDHQRQAGARVEPLPGTGPRNFWRRNHRRRLAHLRHELIAASRYVAMKRGSVAVSPSARRSAKMHWLRFPSSTTVVGQTAFSSLGLVEQLAGVGDHVEQHVERSRRHFDHAIRTAELPPRSIEVKFPEFEVLRLGGVVQIASRRT